MKNKVYLLTIILFQLSQIAASQEIIRDSLYSKIMKEQRKIEVVLPDDYKPGSGMRYEVTYVTDGEWNTKIVAQLQRFAQIQFMPPNIIVSLPNNYVNGDNMRLRDLTPTHIQQNPVSGGADNYIAFIKNELIPYIEKKYPARGFRTLQGGSLGGLFGMYTFFKEPDLFQSYMLNDPAFWWDNGLLMKMAAEKLPTLPNPGRTLLFTGREGEAFEGMGVKAMDSIFHANAPAALHWKMVKYTGETHNSTLFKTVYDGLKYTYEGYTTDSIEFHPMAGIVLKDKPFNLYCNNDVRTTLRYTTDGSEPTATSPAIGEGITSVTVPVQLRMKSITARKEYEKNLTARYQVGNVLPDVKLFVKPKPGGLDSLPNHIRGYIEIKEEGYYVVGLMHPTGNAVISLSSQQLFDYDTKKGNGRDQTFIVPLQKGFYPLDIKYTGHAPEIMYIPAGANNPLPLSAASLYH